MIDLTKKISLFVALAVGVLLSGCATDGNGWYDEMFTERDGVRPAHRPTASKVSYTHRIGFNNEDARLTVDERQRLDSFLARTGIKNRDTYLVLGGGQAGRLSERRRSTVRAFLELRDVQTAAPSTPFSSNDADQDVKVVVSRYVVTLPRCPDMTDDPTDGRNNQPYSDFGCANAVNLGLMVANPEDLVHGRDMGGADGDYMTGSIQRYRAGETKALLGESGTTENVTADDLMKAVTGEK